jgi:hypothetical protein
MSTLNPNAPDFVPFTQEELDFGDKEVEFYETYYTSDKADRGLGTVFYTHEDHFAFVISWLKKNSW